MMAKTWNIKALLHFLCTNTTCFLLVWNEHKAILPLKKLFSSFAMPHFPCMFLPFGRVPCQRNKSFNWQLIWALHQSWRAVICKTLPPRDLILPSFHKQAKCQKYDIYSDLDPFLKKRGVARDIRLVAMWNGWHVWLGRNIIVDEIFTRWLPCA